MQLLQAQNFSIVRPGFERCKETHLMSESEKSKLDHLSSRRVFVTTSTAAAVGLLGAWGAKPAEAAIARWRSSFS